MKNIRVNLVLLCLSMIIVTLIFAVPSFAKVDPKTVVGMWLFDDASGTIAKDSSGNGNNGTLIKIPKWVDGKFGKALQFDSTSASYVEIPDSKSLGITKGTFSAWVQAKFVGENVILMKQTSYFWILDATGLPQLNLSMGGVFKGRVNAKTKVNPDTWTHIACTYDGSKVRFYLNGALDIEVAALAPAGNIDISTSAVRIGERIDPQVTNSFDGIIDDFVIFNDELIVSKS